MSYTLEELEAAGIKPGMAGNGSVAVGSGSKATGAWNTAVGNRSEATGTNSVAMGYTSKATGRQTTAVGYESMASGSDAVALGFHSAASGNNSVALGNTSQAEGTCSIALGYGGQAAGTYAVAIGGDANAAGLCAVALGQGSQAEGQWSTGIGQNTKSTAEQSTALGYNSEVQSGAKGSIAIGASSQVLDTDILESDDTNRGIISVGRSDNGSFTRRIINVSDGVKVSDAATVGQIQTAIGGKFQDGMFSLKIGDTQYTSVADALSGLSESANVENAVTYDENGSLSAGKEGTGKLHLNSDEASISSTAGNGFTASTGGTNVIKGDTTIDGGLTITGDFTVNGETIVTSSDVKELTGTLNELDAYAGDQAQLDVTDAEGEKVTNLTEAVNTNADRITANTAAIQQNSGAIRSLDHRVNQLGSEIDSVGAISAALAGLHPLDYDGSDSKFQIAAAFGAYDGTQAFALGGFYHFNDDVLLSLGVSNTLNGQNKMAGNLGVTFRVGAGTSTAPVSQAALQQELQQVQAENEAQRQRIAAQDEKIADQQRQLDAIKALLANKA